MSGHYTGTSTAIPWAIVAMLVKAPREGRALAELIGASRQCVMRHLRQAEDEGLVRREVRASSSGDRLPDLFVWTGGGE